jgi:putative ABC transport system permease protein
MLKNYLAIAIRNLKKNKLHSFINIIGLSVAFACSIILLINVSFEFSFDNFHTLKDRTFKVYTSVSSKDGEKISSTMGYPQGTMLKTEVSAIKYVSRYKWADGLINYNDKEFDLTTNLVDEDFFKMFSFPIVAGNFKNPLSGLGSAVMSEYAAKIIFNKADPVGKLIKVKVSGEWKQFVVTAILQDFPKNSSFKYDILIRSENDNNYSLNATEWGSQDHDLYIALNDNFTQAQAEQQIKVAIQKYIVQDVEEMKKNGSIPDKNGNFYSMLLMPLKDLHFNTEIGSGDVVSKSYLYTLIVISFFLLAIACFNFINLNLAKSFTRSREVGVRKCLGAGKKQIFIQMWGESSFLTMLALAIGIVGVVIFFNFNKKVEIEFLTKPITILIILFGAALVSFLAGGYPSLVMSGFSTVDTLKGKVSIKKPGVFRNSIIVFQFSITCLLICCTLIIYTQFEFLRNAPLGLNQENIISIPINSKISGKEILEKMRLRLLNRPSIQSITGSSINIGIGKDGGISNWSTGFDYNGKNINSCMVSVDYDYFKTLGIKLVQGNDFNKENTSNSKNNVVVTESMANQFDEKNVIGLSYLIDSGMPMQNIIGIVPDVHLYSLRKKITPTTFFMNNDSEVNYIFIKTISQNPKQVMELVASDYKEIEGEKEFKGSFMNENTSRWYKKEKELSNLFSVAAGIAITLSCLGLFAMAMLIIEQRTKEIGVRKVLGATVSNVTLLLSKEFLKLVFLSVIIAIPIAWYFMNNWLRDFPYRIEMHWWLFLLSALLAIFIATLTVGFHSIKAALSNPIKSIRSE